MFWCELGLFAISDGSFSSATLRERVIGVIRAIRVIRVTRERKIDG